MKLRIINKIIRLDKIRLYQKKLVNQKKKEINVEMKNAPLVLDGL
jgi:hypothetical protein